jgi:glutamate formiminotransferase
VAPAGNQFLLTVPNVSEGTEAEVIDYLRVAFAERPVALLDEHTDRIHNRTVFTAAGEERELLEALEQLARRAIARIDITRQRGAHPRVGSLDVSPIVYLSEAQRQRAQGLALAVGERLGSIGLPVFLYGELATGPERVERSFFRAGGHRGLARRMDEGQLRPDFGPGWIHPTAGAVLVASRPPLAAFNVVLAPDATMDAGRDIAASLREAGGGLPGVRAIAIELGDRRIQISTNVHDPISVPLAEVVATIATLASARGTTPLEAELVGLVPEAALAGYPDDVVPFSTDVRARTIEARLESRRAGA